MVLRKITAGIGGAVGGFLGGCAIIWFVVIPWEARTDPGGYNYTIAYYLLALLIVTIIFGTFVGLGIETALTQRQERRRRALMQVPINDDQTIWPPPPTNPAP